MVLLIIHATGLVNIINFTINAIVTAKEKHKQLCSIVDLVMFTICMQFSNLHRLVPM